MLRLAPSNPPLWRTPSSVQLGTEGTVRFDDITAWQERLLDALAEGVPDQMLLPLARSLGATPEAAERFIAAIGGALTSGPRPPVQVRAAGEVTFETCDHGWHLAIADRMVQAAPDAVAGTRRLRVDLDDEASVAAAVRWWEDLTDAGGEGMVVKPFANLTRTGKGLVQPGIKVRGREYLRIIYGADYTNPDNLSRLRDRDTGHKRSLAAREYALGIEALHRFTGGEPLWRVHEAVFGVLALESDPIDPRL